MGFLSHKKIRLGVRKKLGDPPVDFLEFLRIAWGGRSQLVRSANPPTLKFPGVGGWEKENEIIALAGTRTELGLACEYVLGIDISKLLSDSLSTQC